MKSQGGANWDDYGETAIALNECRTTVQVVGRIHSFLAG